MPTPSHTYPGVFGKVALVTGGSKGIGRGIGLELARQGANVVVNYRTDSESAAHVARAISAAGVAVTTLQADVGSETDVECLVRRTLERFGRLDILVNNAAVGGGRTPIIELSAEEWLETHRVNLFGVFLCTQHAARSMISQGGGVIVNIGSIAPAMAYTTISDYNASKGAVHAFTQSAAAELAEYGIRVNGVAPGSIPDGMNRDRFTSTHRTAQSSQNTLLGRLGDPTDIGHAVAFLASDAAQWITGQTLIVDGGTTIKS